MTQYNCNVCGTPLLKKGLLTYCSTCARSYTKKISNLPKINRIWFQYDSEELHTLVVVQNVESFQIGMYDSSLTEMTTYFLRINGNKYHLNHIETVFIEPYSPAFTEQITKLQTKMRENNSLKSNEKDKKTEV